MPAHPRSTSHGFTLVALVVIFTVMSVLVAAALPFWSRIIQREKEEELIFRGLQYAEAIRVFQLRHGRFPLRLEELMTVKPRTIRRLWRDPMTDSGEWGLVYAQPGPGGAPQLGGRTRTGTIGGVAPDQPQRGQVIGGSGPRPLGGEPPGAGRGASRAVAPILGVHSLSQEKAVKSFFGGETYGDWRFTVEILPTAAVVPGSLHAVRANSRWVGRAFLQGLEPEGGTMPGEGRALPGSGTGPSRRDRDGG